MVRKSIAKVLTVINMKRKSKAREDLKKQKYSPIDIRQKKTRAFRRKLTKHEAKKQSLRVHKKLSNFRPRKFALAA